MKNPARKGMTLVEVIVASVILAIAIVSFLMLFVKQNAMVESFKRESHALMMIQSKLEMIKSNNDASTLVSLLSQVNNSTPEIQNVGGIDYKLYYEIRLIDYAGVEGGSAHPRLYEIRVIAQWPDGEGIMKSVSLVTRTNEA
jgi:prepilin-type N-terminal cleavage/methylation domain-containing protein